MRIGASNDRPGWGDPKTSLDSRADGGGTGDLGDFCEAGDSGVLEEIEPKGTFPCTDLTEPLAAREADVLGADPQPLRPTSATTEIAPTSEVDFGPRSQPG